MPDILSQEEIDALLAATGSAGVAHARKILRARDQKAQDTVKGVFEEITPLMMERAMEEAMSPDERLEAEMLKLMAADTASSVLNMYAGKQDRRKKICRVCGGEVVPNQVHYTREQEIGQWHAEAWTLQEGYVCTKCGLKYEFIPPELIQTISPPEETPSGPLPKEAKVPPGKFVGRKNCR